VTKALVHEEQAIGDYDEDENGVTWYGKLYRYRNSDRARWFAFPPAPRHPSSRRSAIPLGGPTVRGLGGPDVSGSQSQVLALLLGDDDLERVACNPAVPVKRYVAGLARELWPDLALFDERQLVATVKAIWLQHVYGAECRQVIWRIIDD